MTASKRITKYLFALTVSTHPVLPPPPPLHLLLYLLPSISPFSSCSSSSQLHVTISKTSVKVVLDCASVGEKAVSAAGNITTDGVEVLGRTVRSRGRRDNSAPVSLSREPQGAPLNRGGADSGDANDPLVDDNESQDSSATISISFIPSGNSLLLPQETRPLLHPNTILSKLAGNRSPLLTAAPVGVDCDGPSSIRGRRLQGN